MNTNKLKQTKAIPLAACLLAISGAATLTLTAAASASPDVTVSADESLDNLPDTIVLDAVIRDFRPKHYEGGHPDFQSFAGSTTVGLVQPTLGDDGVPLLADLRGFKIGTEFRDSEGRHIMPSSYNPELGDQPGTLSTGGSGNGFHSEESFNQWYRDVPGVNSSKVIPLTLVRGEGSNQYVFDSGQHAPYAQMGGFFPINDDLYGNYSQGKNFHFTTEVRTQFTYDEGAGQAFKFTGDDDVWVYVGGQLVIDLGGLHPKREQYIDLDRLDWLEDGKTYPLDIFHAERRTSGSNFRIETTIELRAVELPPTAALYD